MGRSRGYPKELFVQHSPPYLKKVAAIMKKVAYTVARRIKIKDLDIVISLRDDHVKEAVSLAVSIAVDVFLRITCCLLCRTLRRFAAEDGEDS